MMNWWFLALILVAAAAAPRVHRRLELSRAKHPSLRGHSKLAKRLAKLVPFYRFDAGAFFTSDGAPAKVADRRRGGFQRLARALAERAPRSIAFTEALSDGISDARFVDHYRVPFQYRDYLRERLKVANVVDASDGARLRDLDGNWCYDLSGSYGVNVFGYEHYKACIADGAARVEALGPVLGAYHPLIAENVAKLKSLSGLNEVSFHMSGTEAVMQAVSLARYHTGRSHVVRFCGAYHGWWDGVQPGVGNPRATHDVYTLKDMDADTLTVLGTRTDIACVLVNPLQALHPNANAPGDAMLVTSERRAGFQREAYARWLTTLREICTQRGIVLIFDEVFLGFRLARGGAQEYFGVRADMVTYGKTLGGGLPVGVVCGRRALMQRFREDRPSDICFARGTFNSHPYVMGAMNEFLRRLDDPRSRPDYDALDRLWEKRFAALNADLARCGLPVRLAHLSSVATVLYESPGRYNWMFQFYLRAEGLALSWVGSGRFIFPHDLAEEDFQSICQRIRTAALAMKADGWWWHPNGLDNRGIRKQIARELLATRLAPLLRRRRSQVPAACEEGSAEVL